MLLLASDLLLVLPQVLPDWSPSMRWVLSLAWQLSDWLVALGYHMQYNDERWPERPFLSMKDKLSMTKLQLKIIMQMHVITCDVNVITVQNSS